MKKNIILLLLVSLAVVLIMATQKPNTSLESSLTSRDWTFENATCDHPGISNWMNEVYKGSQYSFHEGNTLIGKFFGYDLSGEWLLDGKHLLLNKGTVREETFEILELSDERLVFKATEKGTPVILSYHSI